MNSILIYGLVIRVPAPAAAEQITNFLQTDSVPFLAFDLKVTSKLLFFLSLFFGNF